MFRDNRSALRRANPLDGYYRRDRPRGRLHRLLPWILDHVQEHEIHHRAQLDMSLWMLGITPPSI
jgi:uncharacterized damage-inducible protein DinB